MKLHLPPPGGGKSSFVGATGVLALYGRIARTYVAWAGTLLPLAVAVFVPLGLVHAIPVHVEATTLEAGSGLELAGGLLALLLLALTGLLGEIFYTGAVTIALTRPHDGEPPSLRQMTRMIDYRTLIAVDLIFGVLVALGLIALVVPGIVAFIYFGLAAPVVEIERHGIRAAFVRSFRLARGRFWYLLAALLPIELFSDAATSAATSLSHSLFADSLVAEWLTDTASNILLTPFYAIAAVLLALQLIAERDGGEPALHSHPPPR